MCNLLTVHMRWSPIWGGGGGEREEKLGNEVLHNPHSSLVSTFQSSFSNRFGHFFDLTRSMSPARVEAVERVFFSAMETTARCR